MVALESLGLPLPGETALISAAIYAGATRHLRIEWVVAAAICGAILGDNGGYWIGHWGGYRLLVRYGAYLRLDQPKVKVARYLFRRHGGAVVFFGRFVSILRTYAAFLAGTSRMPWPRFLAFNAAGGAAWSVLYGFGAYGLGTEVEKLSRPLAIGLGAAAVMAVAVVAILVRRHQRHLEALAEAAYPGPLEGYPGGGPL